MLRTTIQKPRRTTVHTRDVINENYTLCGLRVGCVGIWVYPDLPDNGMRPCPLCEITTMRLERGAR